MDSDRYSRVKRLFEAALDFEPPEREAFVRGEDAELAGEVLEMLASASRSSSLDPLLEEPPAMSSMPERIGAYRLLRVAGRGGMGTVYEAEQEQPRRRVALKVVDPAFGDSSVLLRFEREAEVLGQLEHPGLARIYGAGRHDGQPYFAMEFVGGAELVQHAQQNQLGIRERLELFVLVAEAVAYAHGQGIIHRDLKPANILMDEGGQPKVLDFGVARSADAEAPRVTLQTTTGQLVGTLPYMSPEQAAADPERIDERTDVYSLGVVLYELLAGVLPLPMKGLSVQEAIRVLQEEDPALLGTYDRRLRGDVETIVGKALAKEPERRYLCVEDLCDDIHRYLRNEPIFARPSSVLYQLAKFTRRNRGLVGGIVAGLAIAFGGLALALIASLKNARALALSEARALRQADRSAIAAAAASLESGSVPLARAQLRRVPEERRGWEWSYYWAQLDSSQSHFRLEAPLLSLGFAGSSQRLVIVDSGGRIQHWDPARREVTLAVELGRSLPVRSWQNPNFPSCCVLDASGHSLFLVEAGRVRVFDTRTGEVVVETALPAALEGVAVHPDGTRAALYGEGGLWLWSRSTGIWKQVTEERFHRLDFAEDGHLYALWNDPVEGRSVLVDPDVGEVLSRGFETTPAFQIELIDGADELFIARADDKKAIREVVRGGGETAYVAHSLMPRAVAWSQACSRMVSGGEDHRVCVWQRGQGGRPLAELHGHEEPVDVVAIEGAGRFVAAATTYDVRIWDLESRSGARVLEHPVYVYTVDYAQDDSLLSSDWKGLFRRWSPQGELLEEVQAVPAGSRLDYSDDRRWYVRQNWEHLALLDQALQQVVRVTLDAKLSDVSMNGDGSLVAARSPGTIYVLRAPELEAVFEYSLADFGKPVPSRFGAVLLDRAGERLFAEDAHGDLVCWSLPSGRELWRMPGPEALISRLAFCPREAWLAVAGEDGSTQVIDVASQAVIAQLGRHASRVYALAFTPDRTRLATGSDDTTIRLWDLEDGAETAVFTGHSDYVADLCFSFDGTRLASASGDGTLRVWDTVPRSAR